VKTSLPHECRTAETASGFSIIATKGLKPMHRILVFDDDASWLGNVASKLKAEGFVVTAYGTEAALISALRIDSIAQPDVAVLDIQIGTGSGDNAGFRLCDQIRRRWPQVTVFFLTSYAQDKVIKEQASMRAAIPLSKADGDVGQVLVNQITAWVPSPEEDEGKRVGNLWINKRKRTATWRDRQVRLTGHQLEITRYLTILPGAVRTYSEIREGSWIPRFGTTNHERGKDSKSSEDQLTADLIQTQVGLIRQRFQTAEDGWAKANGCDPLSFKSIIETIPGVGYAWRKK
jgi:DNA-binding response OmpR family regulator